MTPAQHAERVVARIQAERVAAGRAPTIESESVYRLLSAVVEANSKRTQPVKS